MNRNFRPSFIFTTLIAAGLTLINGNGCIHRVLFKFDGSGTN